MSHHIYTTDAFVLESSMGREADRRFTLFTRELGMIRASAQGIRLQKSKLRYSLQDFSYSTVSVVRGKEWWRITSAISDSNLYLAYKDTKYIVYAFARIFRLMNRLIPEEEKNEALFEVLFQAVQYIAHHPPTTETINAFEYIVVMRILSELGYIGSTSLTHLISEPLSNHLLSEAQAHSKELVALINSSIRESHL